MRDPEPMHDPLDTEPAVPLVCEDPEPIRSPGVAISDDAPVRRHADPPVEHLPVLGDDLPRTLPRVRTWMVLVLLLAFGLGIAGLFVLGYLPHRAVKQEIATAAAQARSARPIVIVAPARRQEASTTLTLPAEVQAFQQTRIFPRATGYLSRQYVDIGDQVKAGQLLAEIAAPEVDAQLAQARAAAAQATANVEKARIDFELAQATYLRYEAFSQTGGLTQQQLDEKRTEFNQAKAALEMNRAQLDAAQAEVRRLEALQSYQKVVAPFSGTIGTRNYDVGALLMPGNTAPGTELFQINQTDVLRVFVNVPQGYATDVAPGQEAELIVRNYPGRRFVGQISRSSEALDPTTRMLRVQINIPNDDGLLMPGMYAQARLKVTLREPPLLIPAGALVYDADGLRVAVVSGDRVQMRPITTGRDLGTEIEVTEGLNEGDLVVTNPSTRLADGVEVEIADRPPPAKKR